MGGKKIFLEHLARRRELTHILTSGHVNGASEEKQVGRGLLCIFTHLIDRRASQARTLVVDLNRLPARRDLERSRG